MTMRPRIAVIMDENTSGDGRRYEVSKAYFQAIRDAAIEAIEAPGHPFAIGLQWHPGLLSAEEHPGDAIFRGLVSVC